jgi:hypothetical protein
MDQGTFGALGVLFLLALGVLWLFVPFALFGLKGRIDRTNDLLEDIKLELRSGQQASISELIELRRRADS